MATLNLQVAAGNDDATESADQSSTYDRSGAFVRVRARTSTAYQFGAGMRWQATVPAGSTINSATLQVLVYDDTTPYDDVDCHIYGEAVDNSAEFPEASPAIWDRTKTTANVDWAQNDLGTGWKSQVVTAIVAEIVARPGWASGNYLCIMLLGDNDVQQTNSLRFRTFEQAGNVSGAKLDIDYTPPVTVVRRHPTQHLSDMALI